MSKWEELKDTEKGKLVMEMFGGEENFNENWFNPGNKKVMDKMMETFGSRGLETEQMKLQMVLDVCGKIFDEKYRDILLDMKFLSYYDCFTTEELKCISDFNKSSAAKKLIGITSQDNNLNILYDDYLRISYQEAEPQLKEIDKMFLAPESDVVN